VVFRPYRGPDEIFETDSSALLFRALDRAAVRAQRVVSLEASGRALDAPSRAALNAYLRTHRIGRGAGQPFYRSTAVVGRTRWLWRIFETYLDFSFVA
jgi:hypothetical protein